MSHTRDAPQDRAKDWETDWDMVTVGESMALFMGPPAAPLRPGGHATFSFAGAESNVAIGASRLGHRVAYVSRLGNDDMGRAILQSLRGEGVGTCGVRLDDEHPTSLMVRQHRTADLVTVSYYRREGAGSRICPDDIDAELIRRCRLLHITGITQSLSATACEAIEYAVSVATAAGVRVSLDVNYRNLMWSPEVAGRTLRRLLSCVDILFGDENELLMLRPGASADAAAESMQGDAVGEVVLKRGGRGASVWDDAGRLDMPAVAVTAVDPVGAGDAFVAGYLSAYLDGAGVDERLRRAVACGAFAVSVRGDWEGNPRRDELGAIGLPGQVRR
jgi:2-dehydro-3-deoxygluconokinase